MLLALFLSCKDPALAPYQEALSAYDRGVAALEAGEPEKAIAAFAKAQASDPRNPLLKLWQAKALAKAERFEEADAMLTGLIKEQPDIGIAWYNRASYRVRAGRLMESAQDLQKAIELKVCSSLEAARDPDFAPHRKAPEFRGILPETLIVANIKGPEGSLFVGSRFELELQVLSLPDEPLKLQMPDPHCLVLSRIIEDRHEEKGALQRRILLSFTASQPCSAPLGPFAVIGKEDTLALAPVPIQIEAPSSFTVSTLPPLLIPPLPGSLTLNQLNQNEGTALMADPGTSLKGVPDRKPEISLELRVDGQLRASGGWWRE
jgi:hypothetical protein